MCLRSISGIILVAITIAFASVGTGANLPPDTTGCAIGFARADLSGVVTEFKNSRFYFFNNQKALRTLHFDAASDGLVSDAVLDSKLESLAKKLNENFGKISAAATELRGRGVNLSGTPTGFTIAPNAVSHDAGWKRLAESLTRIKSKLTPAEYDRAHRYIEVNQAGVESKPGDIDAPSLELALRNAQAPAENLPAKTDLADKPALSPEQAKAEARARLEKVGIVDRPIEIVSELPKTLPEIERLITDIKFGKKTASPELAKKIQAIEAVKADIAAAKRAAAEAELRRTAYS